MLYSKVHSSFSALGKAHPGDLGTCVCVGDHLTHMALILQLQTSIDAPEGRRGTSEWPLPYGNLAATVLSFSATHWQVNSFLPDLIILGWACSF